MDKILAILENDATATVEQIAVMLNEDINTVREKN